MSTIHPRAVAIIGGAVAGAEVAKALSEQGHLVVVFEQNARPFGKIEDGLPRWHSALRSKESEKIVEILKSPNVIFVPKTKIGEHISIDALFQDWKFEAVVLACGAWRDRPLPIAGIDSYIGKGLVYQNPFIISFNHAEDLNYTGPRFPAVDRGLVIGGGLASIDCVKVLMLETTRKKLMERGIEVDVEEMEKAGIPRTLEQHKLRFEDLGLHGATLVYRKRAEDMPLQEIPEDAPPEKIARMRERLGEILGRMREKYCFHFEPLCAPHQAIVEDGKLVGIKFKRSKVENGKIVPSDEMIELKSNLVVSSIGSIPAPIPGIPMKGELFDFSDWDLGRADAMPRLFSAGNVVTGKGNIVASRRHARTVSKVLEAYLGLSDASLDRGSTLSAELDASVRDVAEKLVAQIGALPETPEVTRKTILSRAEARQHEIGFDPKNLGAI